MGEEALRHPLFLAAYMTGFVAMAGSIWFGYRKPDEVPGPKRWGLGLSERIVMTMAQHC